MKCGGWKQVCDGGCGGQVEGAWVCGGRSFVPAAAGIILRACYAPCSTDNTDECYAATPFAVLRYAVSYCAVLRCAMLARCCARAWQRGKLNATASMKPPTSFCLYHHTHEPYGFKRPATPCPVLAYGLSFGTAI
eukprot:3538345-Rhodomonas_salina.1